MKTAQMKIYHAGPTETPRHTTSPTREFTSRPVHWLQLLSLALALCISGTTSLSANSLAAADSIYRFQNKMAERGHVASQYALAYMYESGQGTDKDLAQATDWYRKAAQQGYIPARDRLVYIEILNNGYQPQQQQQWLLRLKQTADDYDHKHQGESAFLLGQLYAAGLALNKSLSMALKYLHLAEAANVIGSDSEIRRVEAELEALRANYVDPDSEPAKSTPQTGKASATAKPQQPVNKPAESTANKPASKPASQPVTRRAEAATPRPAPSPVAQNKPVVKPADKPASKHGAAAATADTKNTRAASSAARPQAAPAAKQDSKAEAEAQEPHPMQVICSGWQRLDSACR